MVANHNSHLDVFVLMSLFPGALLSRLRPVAAADYFLRHRLLSWFARRVLAILPIDATAGRADGIPGADRVGPGKGADRDPFP